MRGAYLGSGEEREKRRSRCGSFHGGAAIHLLAIHQAEHADNFHARLARGLDRVDGGTPRGADIIHNYNARAGLAEAFDAAACAVGLFGLADEETVDIRCVGMLDMIPCAGRGNVGDQRVCAHRESADGCGAQIVFADQIVEDQPGKASAFSMERGGSAVDVVIAARARGEDKIPQAKGVLRDQVEKGVPMVGHVLCKL